MSKIFRFTALCSVLLLCAAMAFAASQNAVVYGTVYDASAKPLGGVKVMLENPAIAVSRTTTTAADGSYSFSEVAPASGYKVSATQNGTLIDARTDITVNVGEESVIFPALKASATPQPTESSAMNMPVSTEKVATAQSGVITGEQLRSLPLYNRNFLTLGTLTPHTHPSGAADPLGEASFSVAGNRSTGNSFLVDGADNRASSSNQAVPFQVNDAIQEFRVISSGGQAEYGGNGGVVNVVTKRGGNNWHGSAFGYFGADQLNGDSPLSVYNGTGLDQAMSRMQNPDFAFGSGLLTTTPQYYNDYVGTALFTGYCTDGIDITGATGANSCGGGVGTITAGGATGNNTLVDPTAFRAAHDQFKQPWQSQQFGANIGGPIMKDRVFVFGSYEGTHIDNPNQVFERVASSFDRTFDPYTAGMVIPNPDDFAQTQALLGLMPTSNVVAVPGVLEFFQGQTPNHTMVHNGVGRVDWVYGPKDSFGVRWLGQWLNQLHDDTMPASGTYAGNGADRTAFNQNLDINYTHIFSSSLLNQAHAGFNRFMLKEQAQDRNFNATTLGLSNPTMMTYMLAGIDPQYSGAVPQYGSCGFSSACDGAIGGWNDSPDGTFQTIALAPAFTVMDPTMDGLFPFMRIGAPLYAPSVHEDWSWFAQDNVSWTKGRHQFKFGAEYDHFLNSLYDGGMNRGLVYTGNIGQFTHGAETCNDFCEAFGPGSFAFTDPGFDFAQKNFTPNNVDLYSHNVAFFAEDTIRAYSRLSVTLGIRWEYFSRPLEQHDQLWNFDPLANGLVQQGSTSVVSQYGDICTGTGTSGNNQADFGLGNYGGSLPQVVVDPALAGFFGQWSCLATGRNGLDHTAWTNFAPRIGAAWDLFGDGKTVARFGVGMFYDREPSTYYSQLAYNRPTTLFVPGGALSFPTPSVGNPATQMAQATYGSFYNFANYGFTNLDPNTLSTNLEAFLAAAVQPNAMYGRDPNHDSNPRVWQISANIQHQFTNNVVAEAGYVGSYGGKLATFSNVNFNNEWYCSAAVIGGGAPGNCDNNSFSPAFYQSNQGESQYNSLYVRARVAEWHGLRLNGTYTFAHARDNASALVFPQDPITYFNNGCGYQGFGQGNIWGCTGGLTAVFGGASPALASTVQPLTTTGQGGVMTTPYYLPQDPYNLKGNWGRSDYNSNHRFVIDWTYDVPSLQKRYGWSKYMDYWQLSGITIVQSGQPYSIFSSVGNELTSLAFASGPVATSTNPNGAIDLTNLTTAPNVCGALVNPSPTGWFSADGQTGTPCLGNTQRNEFTGPMYSTFNMSIQKGFPIGSEQHMLNLRAEFYNLFGADNFYNPISLLSTDGFTLNPDFGKIKSAHDPRQIQFAVRYSW